MSSGLDEGEDGGCGDGGSNGISLLLEVASSMPSSPDTDGCEHSSLAAHVTECTLSISTGSTASNSRNTGDGTTSSPGFSRMLHTCMEVDSMTLTSVLGNVGVHEVDDIRSDSS